jgi:hypothetical protein
LATGALAYYGAQASSATTAANNIPKSTAWDWAKFQTDFTRGFTNAQISYQISNILTLTDLDQKDAQYKMLAENHISHNTEAMSKLILVIDDIRKDNNRDHQIILEKLKDK